MFKLYRVHGSTEYLRVSVTARDDQGYMDPSDYPVAVAFTRSVEPQPDATWHPATWVVQGSTSYARILVGPEGGVDLDPSDWVVWVKVTTTLEEPVLRAGWLILE